MDVNCRTLVFTTNERVPYWVNIVPALFVFSQMKKFDGVVQCIINVQRDYATRKNPTPIVLLFDRAVCNDYVVKNIPMGLNISIIRGPVGTITIPAHDLVTAQEIVDERNEHRKRLRKDAVKLTDL
jgi:hypothetical protein